LLTGNRVMEISKEKKSWQEKLRDSKDLPKVEKITEKMSKRWGEGTVVIPAPVEVNEISMLAKKHGATIGCPITTGIFAWIAANAAEEERREGKKSITPYWRTLKAGGIINPKYPGGNEEQKKMLEREGHKIIQKGKRYVVLVKTE